MLEAEREREREKDRMAVDRATLEARDRAYAESCERAAFERATVEAGGHVTLQLNHIRMRKIRSLCRYWTVQLKMT